MSEPMSCEVFRINFPDLTMATDEIKENIWRVMQQGVGTGNPPGRKAFVGINRREDVIAGFFAHEDLRVAVQYDKDWTKERKEGVEFEHLFFALVLGQGQVVLQQKKVDREFVTINMPTMRREFFDLLGMAFYKAGFPTPRVVKEPFREKRQKSDLIRIFETSQVTYVKVSDLLGRQIPEEVRLFNPDIDKDLILKQTLNGDYTELDELEAKGKKDRQESDLRKAKSVKAAMVTGEPQVVKAIVENQERTFRLIQPERFDTQLDTEPGEAMKEIDIERVIKVMRTEYFIPAALVRSPVSLGPLFDWRGSEDNAEQ